MTDALRGAALGLVETIGKTAGMHAADAMVKAANVTLQTAQQPGGGIITAIVVGAVRAGGAAAKGTVGKVGAAHVIPRPHEEVEDIIERPCVR